VARAWMSGQKRWQVAETNPQAVALARELRTSNLLAQILCNRGITDAQAARSFLNPKLTDLADPTSLAGVESAGRRIAQAVADHQRIVIYGDYDMDGIAAVAILFGCLQMVGADVHYYVPHRLEEGYGVNSDAIAKIVTDGTRLIITVDCGISADEPLAQATAAGVDVIVTDHHTIPAQLPRVHSVIHPALPQNTGCFQDLAGAGVAFKLAWQVARQVCGQDKVDAPMREFLLNATCLAALGTIADVVPLLGENRVLATFGLKGLPQSKHPGLRALLDSAGLVGEKLDAYHVGFLLAPRINACGRMGHARLAIEMLTHAAEDRCIKIAQYLNEQNTERQKVEREITQQAIEMTCEMKMDEPANKAIVLAGPWHGGVIGIVASRLVDKFARPVVIISVNGDGQAHGSARSIPGFHICQAFQACSEHLVSFGGHAMAGGVRIEKDKIDAFRLAMQQYAQGQLLQDQLTPTLNIDAQASFADLGPAVVEQLATLAPFGQSNPAPLLAVCDCEILTPPKRMGKTGQAVNMYLRNNGVSMRAIGFGMGDLADQLQGVTRIDIAGEPIINTWNGNTTVEFKLRDLMW
jgi:single-stranded-DNA-specific exonuclease